MSARLCLVTDRRRLALSVGRPVVDGAELLVALAGAAAAAGVDLVQVREANLEAGDLVMLVRAIVAATAGHGCRVVVNDRLDVALAAGAAGVHLKADSFAADAARQLLPAGAVVGRSVHTPAEATDAGPVDYLLAGTVHASQSKAPDAPTLGLGGLRQSSARRKRRCWPSAVSPRRPGPTCGRRGPPVSPGSACSYRMNGRGTPATRGPPCGSCESRVDSPGRVP